MMYRTKWIIKAGMTAAVLMLLIGCSGERQATSERQAVANYLVPASLLVREYSDASKAAQASRTLVALSSAIGELQGVQRRYTALEPPERCKAMHENGLAAMDYAIEAYLAILGGESSDVEIARLFGLAEQRTSLALQNSVELGEYLESTIP